MKRILLITLSVVFIGFTACKKNEPKEEKKTIDVENTKTNVSENETSIKSKTKNTSADLKEVKIETEIEEEFKIISKKPVAITAVAFEGIKVGDSFMDHSEKFKKAEEDNQLDGFKGYQIMNKNAEVVGFATPSSKNESKIGMITISSSNFKTNAGIAVGNTFADLKKIYSNNGISANKNSVKMGMYTFMFDVKKGSALKETSKIEKIIIK